MVEGASLPASHPRIGNRAATIETLRAKPTKDVKADPPAKAVKADDPLPPSHPRIGAGQWNIPGFGSVWRNGVGVDKGKGTALAAAKVPYEFVRNQVEISGKEGETQFTISGTPTKRGDGMLEYPIAPMNQVLSTVDSVSISGK